MQKWLYLIVFLYLGYMPIRSQETIGLILNDSLAYNGYTLFTAERGTYLIDNCGYKINEWQSNYQPGLTVYLLENGNLLRTGRLPTGFNAGGTGGIIEEFNWEGQLVWSYQLSTQQFKQHHDIEPLPNGNILAILWELKPAAEALANGAENAVEYWSEKIIEIEKIGTNQANIIWQWDLWDHLIQDYDSTKSNFGIVEEHPELMNINYAPPNPLSQRGDWLHLNSIFYDQSRDEILLSARFTNEIIIIDHSTTTEEAAGHSGGNRGKGGDILYRWGNPSAYNKSAIPQLLWGQHDARVIPEGYPDEGKIMVFNNGANRPEGAYSTVELIDPPIDLNGNYYLSASETYGPNEFAWQYIAEPPTNFYSNNRASAQYLPNGNTLICEDNTGRFFEITSTGDIVWQYQNTLGPNGPLTQGNLNNRDVGVFRITRYPIDYQGLKDKDLSPGAPIELNPLNYDCELYELANLELEAQASFAINIRQTPEKILIELEQYQGYSYLLSQMNGIILDLRSIDSPSTDLARSTLGPGFNLIVILNSSGEPIYSEKIFNLR